RELDGFTALLATADEDLVQRAPLAAAALTAPSTCDDATALGHRRLPADPVQRLRVDAQASRLASARALYLAGRYDPAARAAVEVRTAATGLGDRPLEASAALLLGRVEIMRGDGAAAERDLVDAARA